MFTRSYDSAPAVGTAGCAAAITICDAVTRSTYVGSEICIAVGVLIWALAIVSTGYSALLEVLKTYITRGIDRVSSATVMLI